MSAHAIHISGTHLGTPLTVDTGRHDTTGEPGTTGADVRVSNAIMTASFVRKPWLIFPNCLKPCCKRDETSRGIQKCNGEEISPGAYELFGKS